jgi:hypothetical protein
MLGMTQSIEECRSHWVASRWVWVEWRWIRHGWSHWVASECAAYMCSMKSFTICFSALLHPKKNSSN